jgi:hypothetical protein
LQRYKIPVRFLGVIDPVSNPAPGNALRMSGMGSIIVTPNVQNVWQGLADRNSGGVKGVLGNYTIFNRFEIDYATTTMTFPFPHSRIGFRPEVQDALKAAAETCGVQFNLKNPPPGGTISIFEEQD